MWEFFITFTLFISTLVLLPLLGISFLVLKITNTLWLTCLSFFYPQVEFLKTTTIRTLLDTHRNKGIVTVLLTIKGPAEPGAVRRHLQEVIRRRDKHGNLTFPRMRHCLVAKCGMYAWFGSKFDLDQNLTVAPASYKGRPITEYNIQEYVSDIVSKYLPSNIPPWQIIIIPSVNESHHYVLLKIHHVLLSDGLNIGDILPLTPPTRVDLNFRTRKSPLINVLPRPQAIPKLIETFNQELTNYWNEFISNYDPLECTKYLKINPGFFEFQAILLIAFVSWIRELKKNFHNVKNDLLSRVKFSLVTMEKEANKRQINFKKFIISFLVTFNPINLLVGTLKMIFKLFLIILLKLPATIYIESVAVLNCISTHYCLYPHTITGKLYNYYIPLIVNSVKELFYYFHIMFVAPRTILQEILLQKQSFQSITLCGRKSVAWSDPVKIESIKNLSKILSVDEIELMLAGISYCISKYLIETKLWIPDDLPVAIRNINSNYIIASGVNVRPEDSVSGILCINMPIFDPEKNLTILESLVEVKNNFRQALNRQGLSHLLSLMQTKFGILTKFLPNALLIVYLKYLSRKYAISITEISNQYPKFKQKTLWGQDVEGLIFWRPPQANTSVSLNLNEYGDCVKLAVMCDSQLIPHHPIFAKGFPEFIKELEKLFTMK